MPSHTHLPPSRGEWSGRMCVVLLVSNIDGAKEAIMVDYGADRAVDGLGPWTEHCKFVMYRVHYCPRKKRVRVRYAYSDVLLRIALPSFLVMETRNPPTIITRSKNAGNPSIPVDLSAVTPYPVQFWGKVCLRLHCRTIPRIKDPWDRTKAIVDRERNSPFEEMDVDCGRGRPVDMGNKQLFLWVFGFNERTLRLFWITSESTPLVFTPDPWRYLISTHETAPFFASNQCKWQFVCAMDLDRLYHVR